MFSFKSKIIECVKVLDCYQKDLIPRMLKCIIKLWPCQYLKTIPLLCTMIDLYEWCDKEQWDPLQSRIVSHLSIMFSNVDFQLADESMNFWNLILHNNIKFWQNNQDDIRIVVNALKKVILYNFKNYKMYYHYFTFLVLMIIGWRIIIDVYTN